MISTQLCERIKPGKVRCANQAVRTFGLKYICLECWRALMRKN